MPQPILAPVPEPAPPIEPAPALQPEPEQEWPSEDELWDAWESSRAAQVASQPVVSAAALGGPTAAGKPATRPAAAPPAASANKATAAPPAAPAASSRAASGSPVARKAAAAAAPAAAASPTGLAPGAAGDPAALLGGSLVPSAADDPLRALVDLAEAEPGWSAAGLEVCGAGGWRPGVGCVAETALRPGAWKAWPLGFLVTGLACTRCFSVLDSLRRSA
jgi:hypothetical protein